MKASEIQSQIDIERWLMAGNALKQSDCPRYWRVASAVYRMRKRGINVLTNLCGKSKYALYYISRSERSRYLRIANKNKQGTIAA